MNSAGTASTTLDFGEPSVDRTVAIDDLAKTADLKEIGVGQTWQNVTGSRVAETTYTNTTGKPIAINIKFQPSSPTTAVILTVAGVVVSQQSANSSYQVGVHLNAIVPSGSSYSYSIPTGSAVNIVVTELR